MSSREERIDQHMKKVRHLAEVNRSSLPNASWTSNSMQKARSFSSAKQGSQPGDLVPISIHELQVARAPYSGRVLFCTVVTPCLIMSSAMVLVEDTNGDLADLAVYNYKKDPNKFLYTGRRIAIMEPFYKQRADGTPGIRVDCPDEIKYDVEPPSVEEASARKEGENSTTTKNNPTGIPHQRRPEIEIPHRRPEMHRIVTGKNVIQLRDNGNSAFQANHYEEAERMYSAAIEAILPSALLKVAHDDHDANLPLEQHGGSFALWILYSNRSMCFLKLGMLDLALKDALFAHTCAPAETSKPLLRCAQALEALGHREQAISILTETLADASFVDTTDTKLLDDLKKTLEARPILRVGPTRIYKTIAAAILFAPQDAEILVDAGVYTEPLVLLKSVTIQSVARKPDEFVPLNHPAGGKGGLEWAEIRVANNHAVYAAAFGNGNTPPRTPPRVRIVGFRIVCEAPIRRSLQAVTADSTIAVVRGCSISCSSGPALAVVSSGGRLIADDSSVYDGAQGGILVDKEGSLSLRQVQVCYNAACGLELRAGGSACIEDCNFFANGRQGIMVWNSAGNLKATRCDVHTHAMESGIIVMDNVGSTAEFQECRIDSNAFAGVAVQTGGRASLLECKISGNNDGVLIQDSGHAVVETCDVFENKSSGIFVGYDHTGKANIINNNIHDNMFKGIFLGVPGQSRRVCLEGNREHGNKGLPPVGIKKEIMRPEYDSSKLRRWAKKVNKNKAKAEPVTNAHHGQAVPAATPFEEMFDRTRLQNVYTTADTLLGCGFCQKMPVKGDAKFPKCSKCQAIAYCSRDCQVKHWKAGHKKVCYPPIPKDPSFIDPYQSI